MNKFFCARLILKPLSKYYVTGSSKVLPTITLYSKAENCSLCDDAKEALMKHQDKFHYVEVDITTNENKKWFDLYKYDIPVVHLNGKEIMRHRVFEKVLLDTIDIANKAVEK